MGLPFFQIFLGMAVGFVAYAFVLRRRRLTEKGQCAEPDRTYLSDHGENCSICFEPMDNAADMTYIQCGHAFHDVCYEALKRHSKVCPICRKNL